MKRSRNESPLGPFRGLSDSDPNRTQLMIGWYRKREVVEFMGELREMITLEQRRGRLRHIIGSLRGRKIGQAVCIRVCREDNRWVLCDTTLAGPTRSKDPFRPRRQRRR